MKTIIALFAASVLGVATSAIAQTPPVPPPTPPPAKSPPLAPMPSAPAALTVPNPFSGMIPGSRDLYQSPTGSDRFQHIPAHPVRPPVVIGGSYGWPYYYPDPGYLPSLDSVHRRKEPTEVSPRGSLMIETIPSNAQVFVDGFYMGLAEEFGLRGRPMSLAAGPHALELRAPGYETVAVSVMIDPVGIRRFRGDLQPLAARAPVASAPAPQPRPAKTYYVIPKCYAGDKPPSGPLPPGCDRKNLQTYK